MAVAVEPDDLVGRVGELIEALDGVAETPAGAVALDLVSALLELYGQGLGRVLAIVDEAGESGAAVRARLLDDGAVASLLLIHDLYPVPLEERVLLALESVRPYMESHGGDVALLGIEGGIVRLKLIGSCTSCKASSSTLELAVRRALEEQAPDIEGMEVEGLEEPVNDPPAGAMLLPMAPPPAPVFELPVLNGTVAAPAPAPAPAAATPRDPGTPVMQPIPGMAGHGFGVPLDIPGLQPPPGWQSPLDGMPGAPLDRAVGAPDGPGPVTALRAPSGPSGWFELPADGIPAPGALAGVRLEDQPVVVANVAGTLLVFADCCAGCEAPLSGGTLTGGFLPCPSCERLYALPRAGRCMAEPDLQLEPFPVLREGTGPARVALPVA